MRKKIEFSVIAGMLILLLGLNYILGKKICATQGEGKNIHIVLDAGHGGADPGKVESSGILEKDINMKIANLLEKELESRDYRVTMVRRGDETFVQNGGNAAELKKRVEFINKQKADMAISIHQNSYGDQSVKGAQVFYYDGSKEGEQMATEVQKALKDVYEGNKRKAKSNGSYFLLKRTEIPMIIVECGFLSNPEETKKLVKDEYQQDIAKAIARGIENYILKNVGNREVL